MRPLITPPSGFDEPVEDVARSRTAGRAANVGIAIGWIALLGRFFFDALAILVSNQVALIHRMPDDSFYYLEIAQRLGRGEGFTFDGMNQTNGFHPLWQIALVPTSVLHGDAMIRAALMLAWACALVAVLLVVRVVWKLAGPGPALLGGIVATQASLPSWINGMEGAAMILMVALLLTALVWLAESPGSARAAVVGLACAGVVLTRLDAVLVIAIVPIAIAWRYRVLRLVRDCVLALAAVLIPFGAWWLLRWDHLLTTSATVKAHAVESMASRQFGGRLTFGYARYVFDISTDYFQNVQSVRGFGGLTPFGLNRVADMLLFIVAVAGAVVVCRRYLAARPLRALSGDAWSIIVVLVLVAAKGAVDLVAVPIWATAWYSAPQRLAGGFLVGAVAWLGLRWLRGLARPAAIVVVALLAISVVPPNIASWSRTRHTAHRDTRWNDQLNLAANWIATEGPAGTYGALDAGQLGFRLDGVRQVVNLDGLANDYAFADLVVNDAGIPERLRAEAIDYYVNRVSDAELADLPCAEVLWTSDGAIPYADESVAYAVAPVRVLDVRGCR